ncbi:MAG: glutaredoxin-related protein [Clostridia bacterium]|nr:glutaredoxin-related protein [Clostridia bacterium]
MIKIYGMSTCPDCTYLYDQIEGKEDTFEYIDIGSHVRKLKEFLKIRDNNPLFAEIREAGRAGIPCFLLEDGTVTLKPEDVGLKARPEDDVAPACSIADHLAGKPGC